MSYNSSIENTFITNKLNSININKFKLIISPKYKLKLSLCKASPDSNGELNLLPKLLALSTNSLILSLSTNLLVAYIPPYTARNPIILTCGSPKLDDNVNAPL